MAAPPYGRRLYAGGAVETTLAADILAGATALTVADGSSYPASAFFIDIDHDNASMEKIYVATRTGNTFNTLSRGADGSTGLAHTAGAKIRHGVVAQDVDEANAMSAALTTKGDLLGHGTPAGPLRVAVGADLSYLRANSAAASGLEYSADPIPKTLVTTKGDLIVATASAAVARLAAAANGSYLRTNSGAATGLEYTTDPLEVLDFAAKGDLIIGTGAAAAAALGSGTQGKVLTVDTTQATGMKYDYSVSVLTTAQRNALAGSDLWRGRTIFNTDTGGIEVYYGATTTWKPPWNLPWGTVSPRTASSSTQAFTGTYANITSLAANITVWLGRRYTAFLQLTHNVSVAGSFFANIVDGTGAQFDGAERQEAHPSLGAAFQLSVYGIYEPAANGSLTAIGQIKATGGGAGIMVALAGSVSAYLTVIDTGPTGNAPAS